MTTAKGSLPDVLSQPVIYPPAYVSGAPIPTQPQLVNPSAGYVVYQYIPTTMTPGGSLSPETQQFFHQLTYVGAYVAVVDFYYQFS
jgi:hypothetical protein